MRYEPLTNLTIQHREEGGQNNKITRVVMKVECLLACISKWASDGVNTVRVVRRGRAETRRIIIVIIAIIVIVVVHLPSSEDVTYWTS